MTPLAIIPVRIGSKSIPWKNVRHMNGWPLFQYAIGIAHRAGIEHVCVTTDDPLVGEDVGGLAVMRPSELARDDTPMLDVVRHAVTEYGARGEWQNGWDCVVLLQPTAPLRRPEHIRAALKLLETTGADSVVSVVEIPAHYSPDYALDVTFGALRPFIPGEVLGYTKDTDLIRLDDLKTARQSARKAYSRDGTVYVTRREVIERGSLYGDKCVPLIIPPHESANIDTEEDWQRAEAIMKARLAG